MNNKIPIVTEADIIKTYSAKQEKRVKEYLKVMCFKNQNISCVRISKLLKLEVWKVHGWLCKGAKPYPIHTVEKCKSYNWLPLYPTPQLARLVGLSMGDGSIQATLAHTFSVVNLGVI